MYSILRHFSASHTLSLSLSFSLFLRFQLQCRALINGSAKIGKVNLDREEEDSEWTDNRFTLDDCLVDHFLISSRSSKHTERESEHTWTHHLHLCRVAVLCSASVHQHRTWSVRYHRCPLSSPSVLLSLLAITTTTTTTTSTSVPFHLRPAEQREVPLQSE